MILIFFVALLTIYRSLAVQIYGTAEHPEEVICDGVSECASTVITGNNIDSVSCDGTLSCFMAAITITNPAENLVVECNGMHSCKGTMITIDYTDSDVSTLTEIVCNGGNACDDAIFTVMNNGDPITIDTIRCGGAHSCKSAEFRLNGDIEINKCECYGDGACLDVTATDFESTCFAMTGNNKLNEFLADRRRFISDSDDDSFEISTTDDFESTLFGSTDVDTTDDSFSSDSDSDSDSSDSDSFESTLFASTDEPSSDSDDSGTTTTAGPATTASVIPTGTSTTGSVPGTTAVSVSTTAVLDDDDDDSDSNEVFGAELKGKNIFDEDLKSESDSENGNISIVVNFDKSILWSLWGILALCMVLNCAFVCYHRKRGKKQVDGLSTDQIYPLP